MRCLRAQGRNLDDSDPWLPDATRYARTVLGMECGWGRWPQWRRWRRRRRRRRGDRPPCGFYCGVRWGAGGSDGGGEGEDAAIAGAIVRVDKELQH